MSGKIHSSALVKRKVWLWLIMGWKQNECLQASTWKQCTILYTTQCATVIHLESKQKEKKCLIPLRRYNLLSSEIWGRESNVEAQKKNSPYLGAEEFHIKWPVLPTYTERLVSVPIDSITYEGTVKNKRKLVE